MAEELILTSTSSKEEVFKQLIPQIKALIANETDLYANLANISAALKQGLDYFWVGFYLVKENELVLGPFQGPIACTRIAFGKGVCGKAWEESKTILVADVDQFPGHIACSSSSRSEIVVPVYDKKKVVMILDVDSEKPDFFDHTDKQYLEDLMRFLSTRL